VARQTRSSRKPARPPKLRRASPRIGKCAPLWCRGPGSLREFLLVRPGAGRQSAAYARPSYPRAHTPEPPAHLRKDLLVAQGGRRLYRPIATLSLLFNYALPVRPEPAGYHAINFLLHAGNVCLVYALARRVSGMRGRRSWPRHCGPCTPSGSRPSPTSPAAPTCWRHGRARRLLLYARLDALEGWRARAAVAGLFAAATAGVFSKETPPCCPASWRSGTCAGREPRWDRRFRLSTRKSGCPTRRERAGTPAVARHPRGCAPRLRRRGRLARPVVDRAQLRTGRLPSPQVVYVDNPCGPPGSWWRDGPRSR